MVSATGPTSAIGIPQKNTAALLPARIGGASIEYIQLEDGGDTTRAVLIAAVGGPAVLPQATLFDQGYKGRVYQTHAVATDDFIRLGKEKVEGTVLAAGSMLVIDDIDASDPIKKVALGYIAAYERE